MDLEPRALSEILTNHFSRYPDMRVQDVYKLLHQAALGSGHAVNDEASAREWLERELAEMGPGPDDPLLDPISPDGEIVRVHLRPYLRLGKDPRALLTAFVRTANEWPGSMEILQGYGKAALQPANLKNWPIRGDEIESFFAHMEALGFPAVHHSDVFLRQYRPAYRVVATRLLEGT